MAYLTGHIFTDIKEAIKYSTGDFGLISIFEDKNGKLHYFLNGKPTK